MIQAALHLTLAALVCLLTSSAPAPIVMLCLALALLPDIDTPKSIIGTTFTSLSVKAGLFLTHIADEN